MLIPINKNTIHNNHNTKIKNALKGRKSRIRDWSKYNKSLKNRANFTLLISPEVFLPPKQTKKPGRRKLYSDALILFLSELREILQIPFRQTMGAAESITVLAGMKLPEYNTLCRRMGQLEIEQKIDQKRFKKPVCLLVDSTGLKTKGEGEWKVRKHGAGYRRGWMKLHVTVDYNTQIITSHLVTTEKTTDGAVLPKLLDNTKPAINTVIGDGAYNSHKLYQQVEEKRGINLLSPPCKNAKLHVKFASTHPGRGGSGGQYADFVDEPGWETHNQYLRECLHLGWDEWKQASGYHRRSLVESTMKRIKNAFSDKIKSKNPKNMNVEVAIRISLMNLWTQNDQINYKQHQNKTIT